jgi:hypothetical protein
MTLSLLCLIEIFTLNSENILIIKNPETLPKNFWGL